MRVNMRKTTSHNCARTHMHTCESVIIKFTMVYAHTKSVTVLKIFNEYSVYGSFLELMMF